MKLSKRIDDNVWVSIDGELKQLRPLVAHIESNQARLLAVARAAYAYDYCMDEDIERKGFHLKRLRKALAAVEDLL